MIVPGLAVFDALTCPRPNILWKMSRVSFREIVTMRTVDPLFKDGALDRLLFPIPKEPPRRDRNSIQDGALVPAGSSEIYPLDPSMQRHMQHQGRSIDQISNSVNHLQDTMTDLKHSFTSLRIELNGPNRHMGEPGPTSGPGFDMIATVLKELKSKSEEIEKLTLEIEALKLKNRFMEDRKPVQTYVPQMNGALPEVHSPGLLQAGRKRAWPDAFPSGRTHPIADSFDEEDMVDDLSLSDLPSHPARAPLKNAHAITDGPTHGLSTSGSPQLRIDVGQKRENVASGAQEQRLGHPEQSPAKRQRLIQHNGEPSNPAPNPEKRRVGRPRKSVNQSAKPNLQTPSTTSSNPQDEPNAPVQVPVASPGLSTAPNPRGRPRRNTRAQSVGPSGFGNKDEVGETEDSEPKSQENSVEGEPNGQKNGDNSTNGDQVDRTNNDDQAAVEERRKAKVAARDVMTRMAMQREEAMETDEAR